MSFTDQLLFDLVAAPVGACAMASALEGVALAGASVPLAEGGSIPTPTGQENAVSAVDNASALYPLIAGDQNNGCH